MLLEAGPAQPRLPRHRLLLGSCRPRLRDQRHSVEVAVHALGEADLAGRGATGYGALPWLAVVRTQVCGRRWCASWVEVARVAVARGPAGERARLLRVVELGARSRHALRVALVGHFLRSAMRRSCVGRQAARQQAVWPAGLAAVSARREGAGACAHRACAPR